MKNLGWRRATLIVLCIGAVGGCSSSDGDADPRRTRSTLKSTPSNMLALETETSCDAFKSYVSASIADLILNVGLVSCPSCVVAAAGGSRLEAAAATDAASFEAFSGTNNQEVGVDELDQVETDSRGNFYIVDGGHLVVADGLPPADLHEIASLELKQQRSLDGLLLDPVNNRLVVVATDFDIFALAATSLLPPSRPTTELFFVDIADPANPAVERRLTIEGFKLAVRRIGDRVHVVTHTTPALPLSVIDDPRLLDLQRQLAATEVESRTRETLADELAALVDTLVAATDAAEYLPEIAVHDSSGETTRVASPICADVAVPGVSMPLALTSVTSIDSDGSSVASLKVANNSWNVYASDSHLYLSQTSGGWWFAPAQRQQTAIYKIEVGVGDPRYRALGLVDGWAGSSFQFSEHEGHLRVATTRAEFDPAANAWSRDNNLYVLRDDRVGRLGVVGSVLGFGPSESIFSARFLGNRGFVVTFRRIDPLFAFDLSVPEDPKLVGELEIPGVSTYIHPLDDAHLLTIGYDGDETRLNGDFQLQIFDVQTLNDPRLVHKYVPEFDAPGFAWTQATFEHLAFNYFPEGGALTVPVQYYASSSADAFSGFIAFAVDPLTGFVELGRLDHSDLARQAFCSDPNAFDPAVCDTGVYLEAAIPRRSVAATLDGETFIYTLSNVGMKVSPATSFAMPAAVLPLPYRNEYPWYIAL